MFFSFFFFKIKNKNWTGFVSCARAGLAGNIGKFPEKSVKIPIKYRNIGDIFGDFLISSSGNSACRERDLSVLDRYIADFVDFLPILISIIGVEFRFKAADIRYIGEISPIKSVYLYIK